MEELQPNVQTTVGQQDSCHAVDNPTSNGKCLPNSATSNTTTNTTPANITGDINTASLEQLRIIVPGQITPNGDLTAEEEDCAKQDQNDCSDHAPYRHAPPPPATHGAALLTLAPPPDDAEDVLDPAITPDLAAEEISAEEIARRNKEINVEKRKYVLEELLSTELDYVRDLSQLIDGYMSMMKDENCEIQMPDNMTGKDKMVFGNIHQIRDWHRDMFSKELEKYVSDPDKIALLFLRSEKRLYMYVKYCENKPKSEYIVTEYFDYFEELRFKLGHKLQIPDLLIKPIQRIMKYQLLLRDIFKFTERAGEPVVNLRKAMDVMLVIPKAANDMMNVGRLQGFSGKITAQGKLLLQETISIMEVSSGNTSTDGKFRERRVFLFEQIVIISESEKRKNEHSNPSYIFKNSLKVNKMAIKDTYESDDLCFVLVDKMPGSDTQIIGKAASLEVKEKWVRTIKELLDMQGDFLRALQSPIAYQKELTKELLAPELIGKSSKTSKHGGKEGKSSSSNHKTKEPTTSARKLDKKNKDNSPKVKRTILGGFRATLRPKSKSHDSSVTATTGGNQQASSGNHGDANYKVSTAVLGAGGVASNGETGE